MRQPHASASPVVDLADSWHRLADAQSALTHSALAAHETVPITPLRHEARDAFDVRVEPRDTAIVVRIAPRVGRPDRLHVWATPELLVIRAEVTGPIEHLLRLPAPVEPEDARVVIDDGGMTITLARRSDLPIVVWPT